MVSKEQLEELQTKHTRIAHVTSADKAEDGSPEWEIVIRKPKGSEYSDFKRHFFDPAKRHDAYDTLVRRTSVHPVGDALTRLLDEWPAIPEACIQAIDTLAGAAGGKR